MTRHKLPAASCPKPCSDCPWRDENQGRPHPLGWFTAKNRTRLWAKLRRGDSMSCHPTDPAVEVPAGARVVPEGRKPRECLGALILQQRELMKLQRLVDSAPGASAFKAYRKVSPGGLSQEGALLLANRAVFGGIPMIGPAVMEKPDLNELVSHEPLGSWQAWLEEGS